MSEEKKPWASVALVSLAAGGLPYSDLLNPYFPDFVPFSLQTPLAALGGALLGITALDYAGMESLPPFGKVRKERLLLSAFLGAFIPEVLSNSLLRDLGYQEILPALGASLAVVGTELLPPKLHIIK